MTQKIIIFGIGYVGRFLAESLLAEGWRVSATCRSLRKKEELSAHGIHTEIFDGTQPIKHWEDFSEGATYILDSIPPIQGSNPVYRFHARDLIDLRPQWFGSLSTTGVYGDHNGGWVDENTPTQPSAQRAKDRVRVENDWLGTSLPTHIFRLGGIYGPGRNAIDNLYQGTATNIVKEGHYFSRVHVDDIVNVLIASMKKPKPHAIYNVVDDEPSSGSDVIEFAAHLMGVPAPPRIPFEIAALSDTAREFYDNNKRVKNALIKADLIPRLKYPSYREGLRHIFAKHIVL